jgi:hypothetical protein
MAASFSLARYLLTVMAALAFSAPARAHDYKHGAITIDNPWSRATTTRVGVVYMTLSIAGSAGDRLVAVGSPAAERAEMHETKVQGGMATMHQVRAVEVKPGAKTELKPGGLHVMLVGLKGPLKEGGMVKLTLTFEKAGPIDIEALIDKPGAMGGHKH